MRNLARRIGFLLGQAGIALVFALLFPLSPELAIRLAHRYMEPLMTTATLADPRAVSGALRAVRHFENTVKTEEAFYLRFQTLGPADLAALKAYYETSDGWIVFRQLCAYYGVGRARATRRTRDLTAATEYPLFFAPR